MFPLLFLQKRRFVTLAREMHYSGCRRGKRLNRIDLVFDRQGGTRWQRDGIPGVENMLKTPLVLSLLSAMLGVESSSGPITGSLQPKVQEAASAPAPELTDKQRIEAEARKSVAHSLVNE